MYYPDIESRKRPKPRVAENIPLLKRREQSIYKPADLWTLDDDFPATKALSYHSDPKSDSSLPFWFLGYDDPRGPYRTKPIDPKEKEKIMEMFDRDI